MRIIDVSSDGANNEGPAMGPAKATQPYDCMIGEKRWKQDLRHHMYNPENEPGRRKTP